MLGMLFFSSCVHVPLEPPGPHALPNDPAPDDQGVYTIIDPVHPIDVTQRVYDGMKPVVYQPPADRFANLPRTGEILAKGGELRIVMLGDSIVNDTSRSNWTFHLQDWYPNVKIIKTTIVRGGTGCWWYRKHHRLEKYVVPCKPDLLIIGGISQFRDIESIRSVIHQVRDACGSDVLLMTGPFGRFDPNVEPDWQEVIHSQDKDYRNQLRKLAEDEKTGFIDMQAVWGWYVKLSGKPVESFMRDAVHANQQGEQILGRTLVQHFAPDHVTTLP